MPDLQQSVRRQVEPESPRPDAFDQQTIRLREMRQSLRPQKLPLQTRGVLMHENAPPGEPPPRQQHEHRPARDASSGGRHTGGDQQLRSIVSPLRPPHRPLLNLCILVRPSSCSTTRPCCSCSPCLTHRKDVAALLPSPTSFSPAKVKNNCLTTATLFATSPNGRPPVSFSESLFQLLSSIQSILSSIRCIPNETE